MEKLILPGYTCVVSATPVKFLRCLNPDIVTEAVYMRVMVALEDRFVRTQDGNVYSNTVCDY